MSNATLKKSTDANFTVVDLVDNFFDESTYLLNNKTFLDNGTDTDNDPHKNVHHGTTTFFVCMFIVVALTLGALAVSTAYLYFNNVNLKRELRESFLEKKTLLERNIRLREENAKYGGARDFLPPNLSNNNRVSEKFLKLKICTLHEVCAVA